MKYMIKQLSNTAYKNQYTPLIIISLASFLIWFGGPSLAIANHVPLGQADKRFYTIMALFLGWFLKIIFTDKPQTQQPQPKAAMPAEFKHPEFVKKLDFLTGRFQGAVQFLKKTIINKQGRDITLNHLPWYLVIGPNGAGKTTLLANSNINFILSKQFKGDIAKNIPPSDVCDWWVTRDSVLIDVPGFYLQSKQRTPANMPEGKQLLSFNNALWNCFLDLIKKFRGKRALSGIIMTLPLPDVLNQQHQNKERLVYDLQQRITEIREQFGENIPFFLTITKCDMLLGFPEFFSDSGSDETAQAWGVTLPLLKANENLVDVCANRFNALIKRLNKQLIWRLHHERNPFTRPYIKDFPLQVERLKENILNVVKLLATGDKALNLQGVYLSSSMQTPPEDTSATIQAATSTQTSLQILRNPVIPSRAYFVKQLLTQAILHSDLPPVINKKYSKKVIGLAAGVTLLVALVLGADIKDSLKQTFAIRHSLAQFQDEAGLQGAHLTKALPLLDALQKTAAKSSHTLLFYSDKAQVSANAAYQQALRTIILPEIKASLENYIQTSSDQNPTQLYAALEAYLMLGDKQHLQANFVIKQFEKIVPGLFNKDNSAQLLSHIHAAFNTAWEPMDLDQDMIAEARKHLFTLTPVQLSFVILKNLAANSVASNVNVGAASSLIGKQIVSQIPTMYTAQAFQSIYDQQIDTAAGEATQGNWVLGSISTLNQLDNTSLVEQLRGIYIGDYIRAWEKVLMGVQLTSATNLEEVDSLVNNLISENSPLLALLKTVRQNTHFAPVLASSAKLAALNNLLDNSNAANVHKMFSTLRGVHAYLQNILQAKNVNAAAFQAAAHRMNDVSGNNPLSQLFNLASLSPEPLRNWLNAIAVQSWHYMLVDSSRYIEKRWNDDIVATHPLNAAHKFPFNANQSQLTELTPYLKALGMQGNLHAFYMNYLQAFVYESSKGWQWKILNNQTLPYSGDGLAQVEVAQRQTPVMPVKTAGMKVVASNKNNHKH